MLSPLLLAMKAGLFRSGPLLQRASGRPLCSLFHQRTRDSAPLAALSAAFSSESRRFPPFPRAAVAATLCRVDPKSGARHYLLARRGKDPGKGSWSLPGGALELGEGTLEGAAREISEEVRLSGGEVLWHPRPFAVTDAIIHSQEGGAVEYHYLIAQCFGWVSASARPEAADDIDEVRWCSLAELLRPTDDPVVESVMAVLSQAEALIEGGIVNPP